MSQLKLVNKNDECVYHHPDDKFVAKIKKRYEFDWVKNLPIEFPARDIYDIDTKIIDFLKLDSKQTFSIEEKIKIFSDKYLDPMNRCKCKIGDKLFYVVAEWYNSTNAYKNMYALTVDNGFSLYSIYKGYILFMIEIGDVNGHRQIRVNYFAKYR